MYQDDAARSWGYKGAECWAFMDVWEEGWRGAGDGLQTHRMMMSERQHDKWVRPR